MPRRANRATRRDALGVYWREGVAWIQFRGERRSLGTSDPGAARLAAQDIHRRAADPTYAAARVSALELVAEEFLADAAFAENRDKPPSDATLEMYGYHIGHMLRLWGASTPIGDIEARAVDSYITARRNEKIGKRGLRLVQAATVDKEMGTLRRLLRFAKRRGWYHHDLDSVLPAGVTARYVPIKRHLLLPQVHALLAELPEARAAECAFITGLGADWCAVERSIPDDYAGEPGNTTSVLVRGTKNAKRFARVPVVEPFGPLVESARTWLIENGAFPPWGNSTRDLAAACVRAQVPRVTVRDLRRSFGKILRARGIDPKLIGSLLRHSDSRIAELVYATLEAEDLGKLVATGAAKYAESTAAHETPQNPGPNPD